MRPSVPLNVALVYRSSSTTDLHQVEALSDASFAPTAERSHQCTLTMLGGALITWLAKFHHSKHL